MAENTNNEKSDEAKRDDSVNTPDPILAGQANQPSGQDGHRPNAPADRDADFKNLRNLMMIAGIGGPFSFLIGGVFLSTIALVCAIIAMTIYKRLYSGSQRLENSERIKRAVIFSIVISAAALVWNIGWLIVVMPEVLQAIQNADLSSLYNGSAADTTSGTGKTIWD